LPIISEVQLEHNLLLNVVKGVLTASDVLEGYGGIGDLPGFHPGLNIVWDFRLAELDGLTGEDIRRIEEHIRQSPHPSFLPHKIAFVAERDVMFGLARMYQGLAREQEVKINVFRSMDEALLWLDGRNKPV